jgi:phosphoglycolate phosphatase-like HAD superfamily hydrolase
MKLDVKKYKTIIFDCDGVVLDSNQIKSDAFYKVALPYGEEAANSLKDYHINNGGVSRYVKFKFFLTNILNKQIVDVELNDLLEKFSYEVKRALLCCDVVEGLSKLRKETKSAVWLIVSGGDQVELREVFEKKGLSKYFDGGIFGSPDNKDEIIKKGISERIISEPCLFIGDSKYDFQSAQNALFDFVFISQWSEVDEWSNWIEKENIFSVEDVMGLINVR